MQENAKTPLSTESYKGVRDFYPEDQFVQNHIFYTWRKAAEKFGYEEYEASVLEPAELYRAKSGEEIVNEQTYTFIDRGDREVTLRPEMTPTVARMVAHRRKELSFPLRWYSIPNLFRYERPQKGRLREHWQLNVDLFGVPGTQAELEVIAVAHHIMRSFGANDSDFEILVNSRKLVNDFYASFGISGDEAYAVSKLIDKRRKISAGEFEDGLRERLGERTADFIAMLDDGAKLKGALEGKESLAEIEKAIEDLSFAGIENVSFSPSLMRGFDYYTGIIFEIFDSNPDNRRSMFGGGRYDHLVELFGAEPVPAVGFGMGDVTLRDFLESRALLPEYRSPASAYVCTAGEGLYGEASKLAAELRDQGVDAAVDLTGRKLGDQLKYAEKHAIPFAIIIGEDEIASGKFKLKELATREERELTFEEIVSELKKYSN